MSEHPIQGRLISSSLIAGLAARTALDTPGVLRLEPTLRHLLPRLGTTAAKNLHPGRDHGAALRHDGVFVTLHEGTADIQLDIATDMAFTALTVADSVQQRIRQAIMYTGITPGRIDILILAIEHAPALSPPRGPR
jgi:uncharacterized alkaline shock family protein YloU